MSKEGTGQAGQAEESFTAKVCRELLRIHYPNYYRNFLTRNPSGEAPVTFFMNALKQGIENDKKALVSSMQHEDVNALFCFRIAGYGADDNTKMTIANASGPLLERVVSWVAYQPEELKKKFFGRLSGHMGMEERLVFYRKNPVLSLRFIGDSVTRDKISSAIKKKSSYQEQIRSAIKLNQVDYLEKMQVKLDAKSVDEYRYLCGLACAFGSMQSLRYLYEQDAAKPAAKRRVPRPGLWLHIAVEYNQAEVVTYLLEQGADLTLTGAHGKTPLKIAKENGWIPLVEQLQAAMEPVKPESGNGGGGGNSGEKAAAASVVAEGADDMRPHSVAAVHSFKDTVLANDSLVSSVLDFLPSNEQVRGRAVSSIFRQSVDGCLLVNIVKMHYPLQYKHLARAAEKSGPMHLRTMFQLEVDKEIKLLGKDDFLALYAARQCGDTKYKKILSLIFSSKVRLAEQAMSWVAQQQPRIKKECFDLVCKRLELDTATYYLSAVRRDQLDGILAQEIPAGLLYDMVMADSNLSKEFKYAVLWDQVDYLSSNKGKLSCLSKPFYLELCYIACKYGNISALTYLVEQDGELEDGARRLQSNLSDNVTLAKTPDLSGTFLHVAVSNRQPEVVEYLLSKDIDVSIVDKDGNTALAFAQANDCFMCLAVLEGHDKASVATPGMGGGGGSK